MAPDPAGLLVPVKMGPPLLVPGTGPCLLMTERGSELGTLALPAYLSPQPTVPVCQLWSRCPCA